MEKEALSLAARAHCFESGHVYWAWKRGSVSNGVLRVQSEIPQQVQSSAGQKKLYVLQLSISDVNADLLRNRLRACQVLLTTVHPDDEDKLLVEVIVDSSLCSVTCGLGVKNETLCVMTNGSTAEGIGTPVHSSHPEVQEDQFGLGSQVSDQCRVRTVRCKESWRCGLRTTTVSEGQRVELDCLGPVMKVMGRFSWRVSWRRAPGVISFDDSLFRRWRAPLLDRLVLDPVREEDSGTYRCDVQDISFRRVKREYWGIRVLPAGLFNLYYLPNESSLDHWNSTGSQQGVLVDSRSTLLMTVFTGLSLAGLGAGLVLLRLCRRSQTRTPGS
ncbi:transmembrane protein 81 [Nelusetta ayraudi]|uniref:transmembrane protein 81 n=1 Tax=Nelusetta ayraudi TaxID=303726 RepID=UPI003F703FBA